MDSIFKQPVEDAVLDALKRSGEHQKVETKVPDEINNIGLIQILISALQDRIYNVAKVAVIVLDRIGWKPGPDEAGAWYWAEKKEWGKCAALGMNALKPLISMMGQEGALKALIAIGAPAVEPLIQEYEKQQVKEFRKAVVAALGQIGDPRAFELLTRELLYQPLGDQVLVSMLQIDHSRTLMVLIKLLLSKYPNQRKFAALKLEELDWKPSPDQDGAAYFAAKRAWNRCVKIGAPAVEPLLIAVQGGEWQERKDAAKALVEIYQSGFLDEQVREKILDGRNLITTAHEDVLGSSSTCAGRDTEHEDKGVGMDFPL